MASGSATSAEKTVPVDELEPVAISDFCNNVAVHLLLSSVFKIAPPSGRLKLNIDGAWNGERNMAGFGAIVRDGIGNFVAAKCGGEDDVFSHLQAEAMALRASLSWAVDWGFQYMLFECDSLQIVEASCDLSLNLLSIGQIVEDIKVLLYSITEGKITHTQRQANSIAHCLA
ncbi:uncharacterized protein [Malus domestica]|uniref:uncharacterized protein n=1 Tax=Malus domestica TaxID=3750 RepID=UPI0007EDB8C7|nr:uncharacterized protein LOC108172241 [Malus domestica]